MKRAFLVLGPESSGTRLMTRLLIAAGCNGSDDHFNQPFDGGVPMNGPELAIWRRSVPHDKQWANIPSMVRALRGANYRVMAVVTTRDWHATCRSQVAMGHVRDYKMAQDNLHDAYPHIFSGLERAQCNFVVVSYDALVRRPKPFLRVLMDMLELPFPESIENIYDGNEKWYA